MSDKQSYQSGIPETDEGWWESVLAEEQKFVSLYSQPVIINPKPVSQGMAESVVESAGVDWEAVKTLYANDYIVAMRVTGYNRGGLLVEGDGLSGFVPFSHLIELVGKDQEADREGRLEGYRGKLLNVKVIECVPENDRIVFSERAALAGSGKRTELFHELKEGAEVNGAVTNITDFGVFVDLGGVECLIHISELSWGRVSHPSQIVSLGEEIKVRVLDVSVERCRVALSLKRLISNPWGRAESEILVGRKVSASITSVLSYGAFARLETGIEGLIHASEMFLESGQTPRDILAEGQNVQVQVLHVDAAHQRLGLSMHLGGE